MGNARISMIVLALITGACSDTSNQTEAEATANADDVQPVDGPQEGDDATAEDGDWTVTSNVDPITDASVVTAAARISGANHSVDAEVSCINGSVPLYHFKVSSFGMGTAFQTIQQSPSLFNPSERSIPYIARVDQYPAQRMYVAPSANANEIVHRGLPMDAPFLGRDFISYLPLGKMVTLRFFLEDGEDTIVIDQTKGGIARVIKPCADAFQARIAESKQEKIERDAQAAARQEQEQRERREIYGSKSAPMPQPESPVFKGDRPSSATDQSVDE